MLRVLLLLLAFALAPQGAWAAPDEPPCAQHLTVGQADAHEVEAASTGDTGHEASCCVDCHVHAVAAPAAQPSGPALAAAVAPLPRAEARGLPRWHERPERPQWSTPA